MTSNKNASPLPDDIKRLLKALEIPGTNNLKVASADHSAADNDALIGIENALKEEGVRSSDRLTKKQFGKIEQSLLNVSASTGIEDIAKAKAALDAAYTEAAQETRGGNPTFSTIEYALIKADAVKDVFNPDFLQKPPPVRAIQDPDPAPFRS